MIFFYEIGDNNLFKFYLVPLELTIIVDNFWIFFTYW